MTARDERDREQDVAREGRDAPPPKDVAVDDVGAASAESFPASDPPSWTGMIAGPPDRSDATDAQPPV